MERLELANRIARSAGQVTLKYFQTDQFSVDFKGDGSPLTVADREAETHLRAEIETHFPDDAIQGEEFPDKPGTSGFGWILDPCLLYTSPSPRDKRQSRMPSSA